MLGWWVRRRIAAFDRDYDYDMAYSEEIYETSPRAFLWFSFVSRLAQHREGVPREPWFAAKIGAAKAEDCGACTQLVVTMAEKEGVSPTLLRAVLSGDAQAMGPDAALGLHFARAVLSRDASEADRLRGEVLGRWGPKGLVSLALAIASSRIFPGVKYALGHGEACTRVRVGGADLPLGKTLA
jgi:hypothetical protein